MFKSLLILTPFLFVTMTSIGCADQKTKNNTYPGTILSEHSSNFDDVQSCDAEIPCPDDLECMYIDALQLNTAICVDSATICDALNCGDGQCFVLESYPSQLVCESSNGSGGGDDSDCTVSSDGTTSCPEEGEGSEPGFPGEEGEGSEPGFPGEGLQE